MDEIQFGCPKCGSDRVREDSTVHVGYTVLSWTPEGEPEDHGDSEMFWDTTEVLDGPAFWCRSCGHNFEKPTRLGTFEWGEETAPFQTGIEDMIAGWLANELDQSNDLHTVTGPDGEEYHIKVTTELVKKD